MKNKWLHLLGDWNPQLLREFQEIRISSLLVATALSLLGQFLLIIYLQAQLPIELDATAPVSNTYCLPNSASTCFRDLNGNFVIHWQLWWFNLFTFLSLFATLVLLVGGVYLLVNNLAVEQRRGTLNFIRLSPQSPQTILLGKLLGVPSLLYLVFILAIPLHLWAGLSAKIPLMLLVSFYIFLIAGCYFFYSAAILFSLISSSFGVAPWLASIIVLLYLCANHYSVTGTLVDWLFLFSPNQAIPYLLEATHLNISSVYGWLFLPSSLYSKYWFNLQVGSNIINLMVSGLLNYGLWSYWIWQAIARCYSHPKKTLLTQKQSYFLVACFEIVIIGFTWVKGDVAAWREGMISHYRFLLIFNLIVFLTLIMSVTRFQPAMENYGRRSLLKAWSNLALSTIGFNLAIASIFLIPWILFNLNTSDQIPALFGLLILCNFILICAALTQVIVLRIAQKPALWIMGTFAMIAVLPVIVLNFIAYNSDTSLFVLWLFTPYAWVATKSASQVNILWAILLQWLVLGLCTWQIVHEIEKVRNISKLRLSG